jgi:hypothetical protein
MYYPVANKTKDRVKLDSAIAVEWEGKRQIFHVSEMSINRYINTRSGSAPPLDVNKD